jgi:hypothetical protein
MANEHAFHSSVNRQIVRDVIFLYKHTQNKKKFRNEKQQKVLPKKLRCVSDTTHFSLILGVTTKSPSNTLWIAILYSNQRKRKNKKQTQHAKRIYLKHQRTKGNWDFPSKTTGLGGQIFETETRRAAWYHLLPKKKRNPPIIPALNPPFFNVFFYFFFIFFFLFFFFFFFFFFSSLSDSGVFLVPKAAAKYLSQPSRGFSAGVCLYGWFRNAWISRSPIN